MTPVMRETWQIKNDDIKLEDKIGNVNNFTATLLHYWSSLSAVLE